MSVIFSLKWPPENGGQRANCQILIKSKLSDFNYFCTRPISELTCLSCRSVCTTSLWFLTLLSNPDKFYNLYPINLYFKINSFWPKYLRFFNKVSNVKLLWVDILILDLECIVHYTGVHFNFNLRILFKFSAFIRWIHHVSPPFLVYKAPTQDTI